MHLISGGKENRFDVDSPGCVRLPDVELESHIAIHRPKRNFLRNIGSVKPIDVDLSVVGLGRILHGLVATAQCRPQKDQKCQPECRTPNIRNEAAHTCDEAGSWVTDVAPRARFESGLRHSSHEFVTSAVFPAACSTRTHFRHSGAPAQIQAFVPNFLAGGAQICCATQDISDSL